MPRASDGTWSDIPNITAVPGQTIESADWNGYRADLRQNEFNAARPIVAGGTGATTPEQALTNLGGVGADNFLDAYSVGDFYGTIRTLDGNWLKRDGSLYDVGDYPELAALLPALPDGVQWSSATVGQSGAETIFSKPGGGYVLARHFQTGGVFFTDVYNSPDGESWSVSATLGPDTAVYDFAFGAGIYIAADGQGKTYASNDAITWTTAGQVLTGTLPYVISVAFASGMFVAAAANNAGKYIYSSPDASVWTVRYTAPGNTRINKVRALNGRLVAVGDNGLVVSSLDGLTWALHATGSALDLFGVTYGNGLYVAVGESGVILTSPNLSSWTVRTSSTSQQLNEVIYSSSGFLAVGNTGIARISAATSGTMWDVSATGTTLNLTDAVFDPAQANKYFVVQPASTSLLKGIRTLPTQFKVPADDPTYGWIRALPLDD